MKLGGEAKNEAIASAVSVRKTLRANLWTLVDIPLISPIYRESVSQQCNNSSFANRKSEGLN